MKHIDLFPKQTKDGKTIRYCRTKLMEEKAEIMKKASSTEKRARYKTKAVNWIFFFVTWILFAYCNPFKF